MNVLWMGLSIFAVICTSFFIILGMSKGFSFISRGKGKEPFRSSWIPIQIYSGDDALDHPDLKKLAELQENGPVK